MTAPIRLGPFELKSICGQGGMAEVWKAVHVEQAIPVAVKVMISDHARDPHYLTAFENEVRAMARLHHPSIVTILDFGVIGIEAEEASDRRLPRGAPYLAMEYASGGTLHQAELPLQFGAIVEVLLSLLDALAHAHARGVLHRDLKPANVLLSGPYDLRGRGLRLTDFGIAHTMEEEREPDRERESSGTPQYMAPEQFFARWRDYGPWTDLYAVGCIAYGLVTGVLPFRGEVFTQLAVQHIRDPMPELQPLVPIPAGFEAWVRRLLEKNPRERFQLAADARWALANLASAAEVERDGTPLEIGRADLAAVEITPTVPWAPKTLTTDAWRDLQQLAAHRMSERPAVMHRIPPLVPSWRRQATAQPPLRLIGAGLGLYGLRAVPMVDRERERDEIWRAVIDARRSNRANAVLLSGAAGNGKTRLAEWMSQRAHEVGGALVMKASHGANGGPRDGIAGMVTKFLRCTGLVRADTEERIEEILRSLGETSPYEWGALTELIHPSPAETGRVIRLESALERHVVVRRLIERVAMERPVIVWLEDVQWGGDAIAFATHVLKSQAESPAPVTFLLTAREDLLAEHPIEASLLEQLRSLPECELVEVGRLPKDDHRELIAELLGLHGQLAERVAERTDGNPLFAVQLVGDWVQRGVLELTESGFALAAGEEAELPDDLHAVWSHRIDGLLAREGSEARIALEVAAVLGADVDSEEWARACHAAGVPVPSRMVSELLRRRLFHPAEHGWSFAHGMLRESLYRTARENGRFESHHHCCARVLSDRYGAESPMAERIARHFLAARRFEEALVPLLYRARAKMMTGEYAEADALLETYGRVLSEAGIEETDERWGQHQVLRARTSTRRGLIEASRGWLELAENGARRNGWMSALAEAIWERGNVAYEENDQGSALERYEEARQLFALIGDEAGAARCLSAIGDSRYRLGNLEGASHRYQGALDIFSRMHDVSGSLGCLWGLGYVHLWRGQPDRAQAAFQRQLSIAEQSGYRHHMARALSAMGETARMNGAYDAAEVDYRHAIKLFEAVGSPEAITGELNLSLIMIGRGDFAASRAHLESIWSRIERTGDRRMMCYLHMQRLPGLADAGEWAMWDRYLEDVRNTLTELRLNDGDVAYTLQVAATVAARIGDTSRARAAYEIALAQWRALRRSDKVEQTERAIAALPRSEP